ncbi:hypothetical protein FHG87_005856 [Trinorchestia longiramus]|nr:hypothetical protein FHG87_005856 [Trinorchestia longiramus]
MWKRLLARQPKIESGHSCGVDRPCKSGCGGSGQCVSQTSGTSAHKEEEMPISGEHHVPTHDAGIRLDMLTPSDAAYTRVSRDTPTKHDLSVVQRTRSLNRVITISDFSKPSPKVSLNVWGDTLGETKPPLTQNSLEPEKNFLKEQHNIDQLDAALELLRSPVEV